MNTWSIGHGETQRITFAVSPEYEGDGGYEWLTASADIQAGAFSGRVDLSLLFSELIYFYDQLEPLYRNLKGEAHFRTIEGQVELDVSIDRTGHVQVAGALMDMAGTGNTLNFVFGFDQTDLSDTIKDLKKCIGNIKRK
jgi:hypothetical protein